jgi:hypothetical protein
LLLLLLLRYAADAQAHYQWFHFQVSTAAGTPLTMHIVNAGEQFSCLHVTTFVTA